MTTRMGNRGYYEARGAVALADIQHESKRAARLDDATYRDTGCEDGLFPRCLECPLVMCRYDLPALIHPHTVKRTLALIDRLTAGERVADVARSLGMARDSVYYFLGRAEHYGIDPERIAAAKAALSVGA